MSIYDQKINTLEGEPADLSQYEGKAVLVVNVASKCGLTPQYETLEKLQQQYGDQGFSVVGFPCNQFLGQEPGSAEEIQEFVVDYETARGLPLSTADRVAARAAYVYCTAYGARCEHVLALTGQAAPGRFRERLANTGAALLA